MRKFTFCFYNGLRNHVYFTFTAHLIRTSHSSGAQQPLVADGLCIENARLVKPLTTIDEETEALG